MASSNEVAPSSAIWADAGMATNRAVINDAKIAADRMHMNEMPFYKTIGLIKNYQNGTGK
jgi:hypothetical protein